MLQDALQTVDLLPAATQISVCLTTLEPFLHRSISRKPTIDLMPKQPWRVCSFNRHTAEAMPSQRKGIEAKAVYSSALEVTRHNEFGCWSGNRARIGKVLNTYGESSLEQFL